MKRNWARAIWLSGLLVIAPVSAAFAAQINNYTIPVAASFNDGCTGDLVNLTGNFHLRSAATTSSNGGRHVSLSANYEDLRLYDTVTGITCAGHGNSAFAFNFGAGATVEYTIGTHIGLACPGPANNTLIDEKIHVTIDANGNLSASVSDFTSRCGQ